MKSDKTDHGIDRGLYFQLIFTDEIYQNVHTCDELSSLCYWLNCLRLKLLINNIIHKILMCPNYGISNVDIVARGSNQSSSTGIHCVS